MGDVFESVVPEEHYKGEMSRLSGEIYELEHEISKLKSLLIDLKIEIRNVQFYEDGTLTNDELLDGVVEKIELGLKEGK